MVQTTTHLARDLLIEVSGAMRLVSTGRIAFRTQTWACLQTALPRKEMDMPFYMNDNNTPRPSAQISLDNRLRDAIDSIIEDELDAGATSEELLGMIVSHVSNMIGEKTIMRQLLLRRAQRLKG